MPISTLCVSSQLSRMALPKSSHKMGGLAELFRPGGQSFDKNSRRLEAWTGPLLNGIKIYRIG